MRKKMRMECRTIEWRTRTRQDMADIWHGNARVRVRIYTKFGLLSSKLQARYKKMKRF